MKRLIIILFTLITFDAASQNQIIDPTVEVNRDFEGKMMEITKGKLGTLIADSLYRFNLDFNYSIFDKPYKDLYEFSPVASVKVPQLEHIGSPDLIAKIGIGYPLSPQADILYTPEFERNHFLKLRGTYSLYKGNVPCYNAIQGEVKETGKTVDNSENDYGIKGEYTYAWKSGEMNIYAGTKGVKREFFQRENNVLQHKFNQLEGGIGVKSSGAGEYGRKFNYALQGNYTRTSDNPLKENLYSVSGEFGPTVGKYNKLMVSAGIKAIDYNGISDFHYGIFSITPQYRYANGKLNINLGITVQGKFTNSKNEADLYHTSIFPAIDLSFDLLPDKIWVYGEIDGSNTLNPWSEVIWKNNYVHPSLGAEQLKASSVPLNIEGGLRSRFTDHFTWTLFAAYKIHNGMQQFLYNLDEKYFTTYYANHREFGAGGEIRVDTENIDAGASIKYSSFTKAKESTFVNGVEASGIPALSGNIYAVYNWHSKLNIGASCYMQGEEKAVLSDGTTAVVKGFADLQATAEYIINPMFTVWLRGDNLLGAKTQYTPFYQRKTRGISAGIIVKL